MKDQRITLLKKWAEILAENARIGALIGRPLALRSIEAIPGPRAGALEISAGVDSRKLLTRLQEADHALMRQFIPWRFPGQPAAFMSSRYVRLEAGWPDELAEKDITLASLGQNPKGGGRWIAGKSETGTTITLGISDTVPHWLFGGWTGSGKTWAMRSAVAQLSQDPENRFCLIDAKWGYGLAPLAHIPGLVAPIANDVESAKKALGWAVAEMRRRYETGDMHTRLVVVIDEIQEIAGKGSDAATTEMIRRLISQGRQARVHVLAGTQHPTKDSLGDSTIRRNLVGRMALRTEDAVSSMVVVGGPTPRADHLLGAGDAYAIVPGGAWRAQLAYIPDPELRRFGTADPELQDWPDWNPEDCGNLPDSGPAWSYSPEEYAIGLTVAHEGHGRPALVQALESHDLPRPGSERAARLLKISNQMNDWLLDNCTQYLIEAD